MFKEVAAILGIVSAALTGSIAPASSDTGDFSSPAAQVSWATGADMSSYGQNDVAVSTARSLLAAHGVRGDVDQQYWPSPSGTYNCSSGCSRTCSYTCSTNYRCRY